MSDPEIPASVNEIINFQLEGVPKTSCQLLLALSTKSQTTDSRYGNYVRFVFFFLISNHFAGASRSVDSPYCCSVCLLWHERCNSRSHFTPLLSRFSLNRNSTTYSSYIHGSLSNETLCSTALYELLLSSLQVQAFTSSNNTSLTVLSLSRPNCLKTRWPDPNLILIAWFQVCAKFWVDLVRVWSLFKQSRGNKWNYTFHHVKRLRLLRAVAYEWCIGKCLWLFILMEMTQI